MLYCISIIRVIRIYIMYPQNTSQRVAKHLGFERKYNSISLGRRKSLLRLDRRKNTVSSRRTTINSKAPDRKATVASRRFTDRKHSWWVIVSRVLTFYTPPPVLKYFGFHDSVTQQAFREKLALCTIIAFIMFLVGFMTFGFSRLVCGNPPPRFQLNQELRGDFVAVHGIAYDITKFKHPAGISITSLIGKDVSRLFPPTSASVCSTYGVSDNSKPYPFDCIVPNIWSPANSSLNSTYACHSSTALSKLMSLPKIGEIYYPWSDVNILRSQPQVVFNGKILDLTAYSEYPLYLGKSVYNVVMQNLGKDITRLMSSKDLTGPAMCLADQFAMAFVDTETTGCFISNIVLYLTLVFIAGVIFLRLITAIFFRFFVGWRLGDSDEKVLRSIQKQHSARKRRSPIFREGSEVTLHYSRSNSVTNFSNNMDPESLFHDPNLLHTLIMVPCYSEGYGSMKETLESIYQTDYPSSHKCVIVVADGIIQGHGNNKPTHEYVLDMMSIDKNFSNEDPERGFHPPSFSYVAIADGAKRKNFAKVYAGWYRSSTKRNQLAMILVVKVGNEFEISSSIPKPGNRGKRDSQIILMNFLSKVLFDDRLTELEFDLFYKLWSLTGVHPESYEAVMMVDSDTKVYPSSLRHMVAAMVKDPNVIGLCGETLVGNPWDSFITMIQVFEYFISHHLAKSFESLFGIVTCLPGCFSMYRVKIPKAPDSDLYVPILANPDIVEEYSENVVDTLHKKNLLLLGEDRFLSTLLLKSFPKRKMIFVPKALCETVIPDSFKVLLSQRRRWINSTIHNLLELILVQDLCGTFCFSMQFVVFMELIGTIVLPAAISFTLYIVIDTAIPDPNKTVPYITIILLVAILGLPGLIMVFLSGRIQHVFWMLIYLIGLPIWNFILPLYAFWHFDDFSWGETRKTLGDEKGEDHGKRDGEFDGTGIIMKTWSEWMIHENIEAEKTNILTSLVQNSEILKSQRSGRQYPVTGISQEHGNFPRYSDYQSIPVFSANWNVAGRRQ